jgi:hypothetical protein
MYMLSIKLLITLTLTANTRVVRIVGDIFSDRAACANFYK